MSIRFEQWQTINLYRDKACTQLEYILTCPKRKQRYIYYNIVKHIPSKMSCCFKRKEKHITIGYINNISRQPQPKPRKLKFNTCGKLYTGVIPFGGSLIPTIVEFNFVDDRCYFYKDKKHIQDLYLNIN